MIEHGWNAPYWKVDYIRDRFKTVQRKTGCSACDIDAETGFHDGDQWRSVRFRGTRAEVELAEGAIKAFMANGDTPLFYDNFAKRRLSVSWETLAALGIINPAWRHKEYF